MARNTYVMVLVLAVFVSTGLVSPAYADTLVPFLESVSGSITPTSNASVPLNLVGYSPGSPRVWLEGIRILEEDLSVDLEVANASPSTAYGTVTNAVKTQFPGGTLAAGTQVISYMVHVYHNQLDSGFAGQLVFANPILGVIATNVQENGAYLDNTDWLFDPSRSFPRVTYTDRGFEDEVWPYIWRDSVYFSGTRNQIANFDVLAGGSEESGQYDEFRILTATPEPGALLLFGTVAAALAVAVNRRRRTRVARS